MTANEMRYEFLIGYDKLTNGSAPGYIDSEISVLLNQGQEEFVKTTYHPLGNKYRQGYESTEKRRKDMSNLTETIFASTIIPQSDDNHPNGTFFVLPSNLLYVIQEEAIINIDNECDTVPYAITLDKNGYGIINIDSTSNLLRIPIKPITHDDYNYTIKNPFKKPSKKKSLRLDYNNDNSVGFRTHELITDGTYDIVRYYIRYIRKPVSIVINMATPSSQVSCELDDSVHREIVSIAVRIATGITKPEDYQIKTVEEQKTE